MYDTYSDEYGFLDFQRSQHGSGMSQKSQAKRFVSELNRISDNTGNSLFNTSQLRDIAKVNNRCMYAQYNHIHKMSLYNDSNYLTSTVSIV